MELLEKQNELMLHKLQLLDNYKSNERSNLSIELIRNLLNIFDPKEHKFQLWASNIKSIQQAYNVDDDLLKSVVITKLKGKACEWFYSNPEHISLSLNNLMKKMETIFDVRFGRLEMKKTLRLRTWNRNESFVEYFQDKIILSGGLQLSNDEIVDEIIDGVQETEIQNQMKMNNKLWANCKEIIRNSYDNDNITMNKQHDNLVNYKEVIPNERIFTNKKFNTNYSLTYKRCFVCGKIGHISYQCQNQNKHKLKNDLYQWDNSEGSHVHSTSIGETLNVSIFDENNVMIRNC